MISLDRSASIKYLFFYSILMAQFGCQKPVDVSTTQAANPIEDTRLGKDGVSRPGTATIPNNNGYEATYPVVSPREASSEPWISKELADDYIQNGGGAATLQMAPNGKYVNGNPQMAPDGSYVGAGDIQMAPNGKYVVGDAQMAPDGTYVGAGDIQMAPNGKYVTGNPTMAPDGSYVGSSENP